MSIYDGELWEGENLAEEREAHTEHESVGLHAY